MKNFALAIYQGTGQPLDLRIDVPKPMMLMSSDDTASVASRGSRFGTDEFPSGDDDCVLSEAELNAEEKRLDALEKQKEKQKELRERKKQLEARRMKIEKEMGVDE
jgi:hypothetical protein